MRFQSLDSGILVSEFGDLAPRKRPEAPPYSVLWPQEAGKLCQFRSVSVKNLKTELENEAPMRSYLIELDDGKMLTGNPKQLDGQNM